jgi:hypothetical protein
MLKPAQSFLKKKSPVLKSVGTELKKWIHIKYLAHKILKKNK